MSTLQRANSVTTPSISTALCLCVCVFRIARELNLQSLTPLYCFLQSIDRIIKDEGNTNTKTLMPCEKFRSHPNLMIKMLTGKKFIYFFPDFNSMHGHKCIIIWMLRSQFVQCNFHIMKCQGNYVFVFMGIKM